MDSYYRCKGGKGFTVALCAAADGTTNSWMTQQKIASFLDNFSRYKTVTSKDIAEEFDTDLVFIPAGYTA